MNRIFLIFISLSFLSAVIIDIPNQYRTIQGGIDNSTDGDTVLVQPGTYIENIDFNGHNITLGSLFIMTGDTSYISQTIIDGNQGHSTVRFVRGEDHLTTLSGFTIANAQAVGVSCSHYSCPTITNLIIKDNPGGGIGGYNNASPLINNVLLTENGNYGIVFTGSTPHITNVSIINNLSHWGMSLNGCEAFISKVLIASNTSDDDNSVSGIILQNSNVVLNNITISDNQIPEDIGYTGGLMCFQSQVVLQNSIVWNNSTPNIFIHSTDHPSSLSIRYSVIEGGESGVVLSGDSELHWMDGNIDLNPLFAAPSDGDFTLIPNSPCIDAGDPNSPTDPDGTIADMGAFFFDQFDCDNYEYLLCDGNQDGWVDILDIVMLVGFILGNIEQDPILYCIFDGNLDGVVDILDLSYGCYNWWIIPGE